ncbi:MAG: hypothetical protein PHF86_11235 [Candidatus Nanoarchaeia archaeon]|nr:hypothetical protein [Candidatus Nanoarchaeia archaeon]
MGKVLKYLIDSLVQVKIENISLHEENINFKIENSQLIEEIKNQENRICNYEKVIDNLGSINGNKNE